MMELFKIMSCIALASVGVAFVWCLAELTIETIKERKNGNKHNR